MVGFESFKNEDNLLLTSFWLFSKSFFPRLESNSQTKSSFDDGNSAWFVHLYIDFIIFTIKYNIFHLE